jgi:NAD(P)-dependent dehydrogenase (short-subunit alcohol dehydrogenase family)
MKSMRAVITGAASGIGRAAALRLAREAAAREGGPAHLMLVDVQQEKLEQVAAELRAAGTLVVTYTGDLTAPTVPDKIIAAAGRQLGGLDALISNAGIIKRASLLELTLEDYERSFAINTRATWLLGKAAHPLLAASRGCIVATASISAHEPTPPLGAYSASKAALVMLVRQMACEWGPDGIRCNTVSPGSTHTPMTDARYSDPVQRAAARQRNPLRMVGSPENQAAAIAFLASPEAAYITGADLLVDGGLQTMLMTASALGDPWRK